jgi:hypothetical protein
VCVCVRARGAARQTEHLGDISTLADPAVVADLISRANAVIADSKHHA